MPNISTSDEREPQARADTAFENQSVRMTWRRRLDPVLFLALAAMLGTLFCVLLVTIWTLQRQGEFDAWRIRPLADERILVNVRDNIGSASILDAAVHPPDGQLYLSKVGGLIHRYDPPTGLWSTESLPTQLINPNVRYLRSGCGTDPFAPAAVVLACPDRQSLWGLTAGEGLVRRVNGSWQVVFGDRSFIGLRGKAVEDSQLTSADLSEDGRWLIVGTAEDGIGVYDRLRHDWLAPDALKPAQDARNVTLVRWALGRFWIAGPNGLMTVHVEGSRLIAEPVKEVRGEVLDLDVTLDRSALLALQRQPCVESSSDRQCLWLGEFRSPSASPNILMDQKHLYPDLTLNAVNFAQYWPDKDQERLVLAGPRGAGGTGGIYVYDVRTHAWTRPYTGSVEATLPVATGSGLYFGSPGGVGRLSRETLNTPAQEAAAALTWLLENRNVVNLQSGRPDELLAFATLPGASQGALFSINTLRKDPPLPIFVPGNSAVDPAGFTAATAISDTVLFLSPEGALLHNVTTRSYDNIDKSLVPRWLLAPDTRLLNAGDFNFALASPTAAQGSYYALPNSKLLLKSFWGKEINAITPQVFPGPVRDLWRWDRQSIGIIGTDESIYQLTGAQPPARLTGPRDLSLSLPFQDVAALGTDLIALTSGSLRRYDANTRTWSGVAMPTGTARPVEVVVQDGQVLARTEDGRLVRVSAPAGLAIGDDRGSEIREEMLSDVLMDSSFLYLAGEGRVERYDLKARRITARWQVAGLGAVQIKAIIDNRPLVLVGDQAFWGESPRSGSDVAALAPFDRAAGAVATLALDASNVWTVRKSDNVVYLKGYSLASKLGLQDARCYFRNPVGAGVSQIQDARLLPNGLIAMITDVGLRFYSPAVRSWYAGPRDGASVGGRLYVLGDYLLLAQSVGNVQRLTRIPLRSIAVPSSCSTDSIAFDARVVEASAWAVDESAAKAAWLLPTGAVVEWTGGQDQTVLAAPNGGPRRGDLRHTFDRSTSWLFATDTSIWRYDIPRRLWSESVLRVPGAERIADVNIEPQSNQEVVTVRTESGKLYWTNWDGARTPIDLTLLYQPPAQTFGRSGDDLLDVQNRSGLWTFVLNNQLKYYDPKQREWSGPAPFAEPDPTLELDDFQGRAVVLGQNGSRWWIAQSTDRAPTTFAVYNLQPGETTALDLDGRIWRLRPDGVLLRCAAPYSQVDCKPAAPSPLVLDRSVTTHAYSAGSTTYLNSGSRLLALDRNSNEGLTVNGNSSLSGATTWRAVGDNLWIARSGDVQLLTRSSAEVKSTVLPGISEMLVDDANHIWGRVGAGWQLWNGKFASPQVTDQMTADQAGLRLFAMEGAAVTAIDDTGMGYWWAANSSRAQKAKYALPSTIPANAISELVHVDGEQWWVRTGAQMAFVHEGLCPAPAASRTATPTTMPSTPRPTPSSSATPAATATPVQVPCSTVDGSVALPTNFGKTTAVRFSPGPAIELWSDTGAAVRISRQSSGSYRVDASSVRAPQPTGTLNDDWTNISKQLVQLPNGAWTLNGIASLTVGSQGELVAPRPVNPLKLAARATLRPARPAELNTGWLRWDRGTNGFSVAAPQGTHLFARNQFVTGGQLLFETADTALVTGQFQLANRFGIWTFHDAALALDRSDISFTPVVLSSPVRAAHSRFITSSGDLAPGAGQTVAHQQQIVINSGGVTLTEDMDARSVYAVLLAGTPVDALADRGFVWDQQRRGLAFASRTLLLQSQPGIAPVDALASFDPGPAGVAGQLRSEGPSGKLFFDNGTWYGSGTGGWSRIADPTASRALLSDADWTWELADHQLAITLKFPALGFAQGASASGYGFTSDRVRGATTDGNVLVIMTDAWLEKAGTPDDLSRWKVARWAASATERLDTVTFVDGQRRVYRRVGTEVSLWDAGSGQFAPVGDTDNPYINRMLAASNRLRFTLTTERGAPRVVKQVRVEQPPTYDAWVTFKSYSGQFPFDYVTSIASFADGLYVGTAAGLEVYRSGSVGWFDMNALYDLRSAGAGNLSAVNRVGTPPEDLDLLMARSSARCIQHQVGQPFADCTAPARLDRRVRASTPLWQWTMSADGGTTGQYRDQAGQLAPKWIAVSNGRLPNDDIKGAAVCDGHAFTLWKSNWVSVHPDATLRFLPGVLNYPLEDLEPVQLVCLEKDIARPGATIPAGLYARGRAGSLRRYAQGTWTPVTDADAAATLGQRAERPPIYDGSRLRLLPPAPNSPFQFERQTLAGQWVALPWRTNHVIVDEWFTVLALSDQLWAATPGGLVAFQRARDGTVLLDPNRLLMLSEPASGGIPCAVTDLMMKDQVLARCDQDSNLVFEGILDGSADQQVFHHSTGGDPFAATRFFAITGSNIVWEWNLAGRQGGRPGYLVSNIHAPDQDTAVPVQIAGGQFNFDQITSLAFYADRVAEIGTVQGGWWQVTPPSGAAWFNALALKRPISYVTAEVTRVGLAKAGERTVLCGTLKAGSRVLRGNESPEQVCEPEFLADDDLWRYSSSGGKMVMEPRNARVVQGQTSRQLAGGRFTDDRVTGLPVPVLNGSEVAYWLPTQAGVLLFNPQARADRIVAPGAWTKGSAAIVLFSMDAGKTISGTVYYSGHALNRLIPDDNLVPRIDLRAPDQAVVHSIGNGPESRILVNWETGGRPGWTWLEDQHLAPVGINSIDIDVSQIPLFLTHQVEWGNPSARLRFQFEQEYVEVSCSGCRSSYRVGLPGDLVLVKPAVLGDRLVLIGTQEVLEINLNHLVVELWGDAARRQ